MAVSERPEEAGWKGLSGRWAGGPADLGNCMADERFGRNNGAARRSRSRERFCEGRDEAGSLSEEQELVSPHRAYPRNAATADKNRGPRTRWAHFGSWRESARWLLPLPVPADTSPHDRSSELRPRSA